MQLRVVFFYAVRDENRGIPKKICKAKIFGEEEERRRKFLPTFVGRRKKRGSDEHRNSRRDNYGQQETKKQGLRLAFFVACLIILKFFMHIFVQVKHLYKFCEIILLRYRKSSNLNSVKNTLTQGNTTPHPPALLRGRVRLYTKDNLLYNFYRVLYNQYIKSKGIYYA